MAAAAVTCCSDASPDACESMKAVSSLPTCRMFSAMEQRQSSTYFLVRPIVTGRSERQRTSRGQREGEAGQGRCCCSCGVRLTFTGSDRPIAVVNDLLDMSRVGLEVGQQAADGVSGHPETRRGRRRAEDDKAERRTGVRPHTTRPQYEQENTRVLAAVCSAALCSELVNYMQSPMQQSRVETESEEEGGAEPMMISLDT